MRRVFIFFVCGECGIPAQILDPSHELGYNAFVRFGNFHGELSVEKTEEMRQHLFKKLREDGKGETADMLEKNTKVLECFFKMDTKEDIVEKHIVDIALSAFNEAAKETMEVMGYNVIAEGGWVIKVYKDGSKEKIKKIGSK